MDTKIADPKGLRQPAIRNIENSFMNKFVACVQNASIPKPPE